MFVYIRVTIQVVPWVFLTSYFITEVALLYKFRILKHNLCFGCQQNPRDNLKGHPLQVTFAENTVESVDIKSTPTQILREVCRDRHRTIAASKIVPFKDRCGVTDLNNIVPENMCLCSEQNDNGVDFSVWTLGQGLRISLLSFDFAISLEM